jgi:ketosteroid isomerase-like protein
MQNHKVVSRDEWLAAQDLWFREILGFRKIDGEWTITHEHSSVPFYMDGSFKAAIDLKP